MSTAGPCVQRPHAPSSYMHAVVAMLARAPPPGGLLRLNFHRDLVVLSAEVAGWEELHQAVPYGALEVAAQREKLRCLREVLSCLVREYNQVRRIISKLPSP
jgi:hypothetical protein